MALCVVQEMKTLKYVAIIAALSVCASCSKRVPAYPDAGLVVQNRGATCGFYSGQKIDGDLASTATTNKMEFTANGHKLLIEWTSEHRRTKDEYEFTITIDGATSHKTVTYVGDPVTLLDTPILASVEDVKR